MNSPSKARKSFLTLLVTAESHSVEPFRTPTHSTPPGNSNPRMLTAYQHHSLNTLTVQARVRVAKIIAVTCSQRVSSQQGQQLPHKGASKARLSASPRFSTHFSTQRNLHRPLQQVRVTGSDPLQVGASKVVVQACIPRSYKNTLPRHSQPPYRQHSTLYPSLTDNTSTFMQSSRLLSFNNSAGRCQQGQR